jgi:predicted 2-oxoglutarate/Fe(II)-dependent dioxygenase YbiX
MLPEIGAPLPWITVPTTREPMLPLNGLAGHLVILGGAGPDMDLAATVEALENARDILTDYDAYWLVAVPTTDGAPVLRNPRARLIPDHDGTVRRALGLPIDGNGMVSLCADRGLRIAASIYPRGPQALDTTTRWLTQTLPAVRDQTVDIDAPVMLIPNVIEADLRAKLIAAWSDDGHEEAGYLRTNDDGSVAHVVDSGRKRRQDHFLDDDNPLAALVHARIGQRVAPWVERATHFKIGFAERYRIACYEAESAGFFAPHRDFTDTNGHRHFAMSIALNDDYQGGTLRFPEFGSKEYVLRPGQAIVYSGSLLHEVTPMTAGRRFALINFLTNSEGAKKVAEYQSKHGEAPERKTVG